MSEVKTKIISSAIGRRKEATASARIISGNGEITVNGKPAAEYFPGLKLKARYLSPFSTTSLSKYSVAAKVIGGGLISQADALVLAISRALAKIKAEHKTALRSAGLLTRDPRERQRRMVGTGGKSRRKKQSPKR
jgi:small subunit ribosomal protein S9